MNQQQCCFVKKKELRLGLDYEIFVKNNLLKVTLRSIQTSNYKLSYVFVYLVITMGLPQIGATQLHGFLCKFYNFRKDCETKVQETRKYFDNTSKTFCKGENDGLFCWENSYVGMVDHKCPKIFQSNGSIQRRCMENGTWQVDWSSGLIKTYSSCLPTHLRVKREQTIKYDYDEPNKNTLLERIMLIYQVGCAISLALLVSALLILTFIRKLHCTRNYVHINLMITFILRYCVVLMKDKVLVDPMKFPKTVDPRELSDIELNFFCSPNILCRLTMAIMHYAVLCNYFWLLIEAVYLQSILSYAMTDQEHFSHYMAIGWGGPLLPTLTWVILRCYLENVGCWEYLNNKAVWWTIKGPVLFTILVNFAIFINILRIIIKKLRANHMARSDYKYRLARSTLALIPLLGIHYIVFALVNDQDFKNTNQETPYIYVKMAFELVFTSFQGAMVAVLYCFMTSEVQNEVSKLLRNYRRRRDLPKSNGNNRKFSTFQTNLGQTQITMSATSSRPSFSGAPTPSSVGNKQTTVLNGASAPSKNNFSSGKTKIVLNENKRSFYQGDSVSSGDSTFDSNVGQPFLKKSSLERITDLKTNHENQIPLK